MARQGHDGLLLNRLRMATTSTQVEKDGSVGMEQERKGRRVFSDFEAGNE